MAIEAKDIFEATSKSVNDLFCENGLGLYIPAYQRSYAWDKAQVKELMHDIFHGYKYLDTSDQSFTFLGTIITIHDREFKTVHPVLQHELPSKVLNVIDGQQRLTTLLILCVAFHEQIRVCQHRYFDEANLLSSSSHEVNSWLKSITLDVLGNLINTIRDKQYSGESPFYPRMIRAFDDQWSRNTNFKYESPIANIIYSYITFLTEQSDKKNLNEFKLNDRNKKIEGDADLRSRFNEISKTLKKLKPHSNDEDNSITLPTLREIALNKNFQSSLLNHEFPSSVIQELILNEIPDYSNLLELILLSKYLLSRVALTVVRGRNEDFAFTIFESLNTTGEPLTAFETFKPQVVVAEKIEDYEGSTSRKHIDHIAEFLSSVKRGEEIQKLTRDLVIYFASNETGDQLSKRLPEQRKYLKEQYDRYRDHKNEREAFVKNLSQVSDFLKFSWVKSKQPSFFGLEPDEISDHSKLCLRFLFKFGHTITIAPIVRFYSVALAAEGIERHLKVKELNEAIKAMTAFSVLWRASRRNTGKIDTQYREILAGVTNDTTQAPPLARSLKIQGTKEHPLVDLLTLKKELLVRLKNNSYGGVSNQEQFIELSYKLPHFDINKELSRLLLLAAYHDSTCDEECSGLIKRGKDGTLPKFLYSEYENESNLSLEHIAPQTLDNGWNENLYQDKDLINTLGNLVLIPGIANSLLSNRAWPEKRVIYNALGSNTQDESLQILTAAKNLHGIEFGENTKSIIENSNYLPQLVAIGNVQEDWNLELIQARSKRILALAYDTFYAWLE